MNLQSEKNYHNAQMILLRRFHFHLLNIPKSTAPREDFKPMQNNPSRLNYFFQITSDRKGL